MNATINHATPDENGIISITLDGVEYAIFEKGWQAYRKTDDPQHPWTHVEYITLEAQAVRYAAGLGPKEPPCGGFFVAEVTPRSHRARRRNPARPHKGIRS